MCNFVCFFVRLRISQRRKKTGVKFCMHVRLPSGQVFSHYGGQRSKVTRHNALSAANTHTGACKWYALAASVMHQQHAAAADKRISWRARGDIGGGVHQGSLRDLQLRTRLAGHSELGQQRQLRPYGGMCVPADALGFFGPIANLKGPYFQPSLSVCVCVCLSLSVSDRHFCKAVTGLATFSARIVIYLMLIRRAGT